MMKEVQALKEFVSELKVTKEEVAFVFEQKIDRILLLGKATEALAETISQLVPAGTPCLGVGLHKIEVGPIQILKGDHPYFGKNSFQSGHAVKNFLEESKDHETMAVFLSGGASSLVELPIDEFTEAEVTEMAKTMIQNGETIEAVNQVRRELSQFKNGGMLMHFRGKKIINIVINDVPSQQIEYVGSGPTCFQDDYPPDIQLGQKWKTFLEGSRRLWHRRKQDASKEVQIENHQIGTVEKMFFKLGHRFPEATFLRPPFNGTGSDCYDDLAKKATKLKKGQILIGGGEINVPTTAKGEGGRCSEFVLQMATRLCAKKKFLIIALATDGQDGNSKSAGGWIDSEIYKNFSHEIPEYLMKHLSGQFLKEQQLEMVTGPTGTNIMDLYLIKKI